MFKGKHSIEFKPLTIFTGTNNSGKSTLLSLTGGMISQYGEYVGKLSSYIQSLYPFSEETSGTKFRDYNSEELIGDDYFEDFTLDNLFLDDITSKYNFMVEDRPEKLQFCYKDEPIIAFIPNPYNYNNLAVYENTSDDFCSIISIDFKKIYFLFISDKSQTEEQIKIITFLEKYIQKGFPKELWMTYLVDASTKFPLFSFGPDNNLNSIDIRTYESFYNDMTNTRSNDFLFFYCTAIYNSIRNNKYLENEFSQSLINCLQFILKNYFLLPLKKQVNNFINLIDLSAYRGLFVNETKSQAYEILSNVIGKESELLGRDSFATSIKDNESKLKSQVGKESDYFGSKIEFLKRWTNEFGLGTGIKFEKKPIKLLTISQSEKTFRYPFELGFGNQQFLPILLAFCTKYNGLFLIEEPESHLHPNLQSKLAYFFNDALKMDKQAQFIIETHSEYFIRKLQYLVAKGQIDKEMVALYYVHNAEKVPSGCSQIQRMEIRDDGIIKQEFGSGFFDESAHLAMDLLNFKRSN